jgi:capsule polysaccharide export protein KpsE/RkpR
MKYSSSIRMINAVVFALIFVAFGCLGCYFSFFASPEFFAQSLSLKPIISLATPAITSAYSLASLA